MARRLFADRAAESSVVVLQIEVGALGEPDPKRSGCGGRGAPMDKARGTDGSAEDGPRERIISLTRSSAVTALGGESGFERTEGVEKGLGLDSQELGHRRVHRDRQAMNSRSLRSCLWIKYLLVHLVVVVVVVIVVVV